MATTLSKGISVPGQIQAAKSKSCVRPIGPRMGARIQSRLPRPVPPNPGLIHLLGHPPHAQNYLCSTLLPLVGRLAQAEQADTNLPFPGACLMLLSQCMSMHWLSFLLSSCTCALWRVCNTRELAQGIYL